MTSLLLVLTGLLIIFSSYSAFTNRKKILQMKLQLKQAQQIEQDLFSKLTSLESKLHSAIEDPVTNLPGWQLFEDRLNQSIKESIRYQLTMGVIFVDINNFKVINEALNYQTGNLVLKEIAKRIESCVRQVDSLTRHSKDIFVVLLGQLNKPEAAAMIAQRILKAIAQPLYIEQQELYLTASIGIAIYPADGASLEELLHAGDEALRIAKNKGKQNYHFYQEHAHENSQRQLSLVTALRRDSIIEEFSLRFQPIFNIETKTIFAMDASVLWQHSQLGLIRSKELFDLADKQNKTNLISEWMIKEACQQFLHWHSLGFHPDFLTIPIGIKQLENSQFIYRVSQILQELNFHPEKLVLEIKENTQQISLDILEKSFNMLQYLNIKLAIDQFGSSAFNLRHLKNFKVDYLKLESSFIGDIEQNVRTQALIKSVVILADHLACQLIVEGVENNKQMNLVKAAGCVLQQGAWLGSALVEPEIIKKMGVSLLE